MDVRLVRQLLSKEEGPKLDFKAELHLGTESGKKELVKDVIAIANTRGGRGHILFGVEDKTKRLIGIDPADFQEESIQQIIYNRSDPPVPVQVEFMAVDGVILALISIFRSAHRPHMMLQTGAFYIRRGSTTDYARRGELAGMMQENGLLSHETILMQRARMEDLDTDRIASFFHGLDIPAAGTNEVLLEAMGFVAEAGPGDLRPTIGGLLLFGRDPWVFLPWHFVRISCGDHVEMVTGSILEMLDRSMAVIRRVMDDPVYPYSAIEETLANALAHRDYLDTTRGIQVNITHRSIEISNPGALLEGNSLYRHQREKNPQRRNPWLYQRLIALDRHKRFLRSGAGLNRIKSAMAPWGEVKYVNIGSDNLFKVILPRPHGHLGEGDAHD